MRSMHTWEVKQEGKEEVAKTGTYTRGMRVR